MRNIWVTRAMIFTDGGYNQYMWLHVPVKEGSILRFHADKKFVKVTAVVEVKKYKQYKLYKVRIE